MEKIQSAIAKARASRTGMAPDPAAPASSTASHPVASSDPHPARQREAAPVASAAPRAAPRPDPQAPPAPVPDVEDRAAAVADVWAALPALKPRARLLERNRIVSYEGGKGATELDKLRTRLIQQMRANGWRRVAITSPGAGCGKSLLAINLGFSLARQPDQRTLVAELDLRRPSMAKSLGISGREDFTQVLEGRARAEECAVRMGANLGFLTNVGASRNSAELLQSAKISKVIDAIEARYDPTIFIFDLPPMLVGDDAMAFVDKVDCVLLVAAAGTTTIKEIDVCERDLATQTNVLGVVLNKCRYMPPESGYGGYA